MFFWFVLLVAATKMPLEEAALVADTEKNLSNILSLDIYGWALLAAETIVS